MPIDIKRALTDSPAAAALIPEIKAALVEQIAAEKRYMRNLAVLNTELQGGPGESITIAKIGGLDALEMPNSAEDTTLSGSVLPISEVQIALTRFNAVVDISRNALQRSKANLYDEATRALGEALAKKEDTYIINKAIAGAGHIIRVNDAPNDDSITAADVMDTDSIKAALEALESNNAPEPYVVIMHPHQKAALWADEQFVNASKYGNSTPGQSGEIPAFLGAQILTTTNIPHAQNNNNVEVYSGLALSARSIAEALGEDITVIEADLAPAGKLATRLIATMSLGAEVLNAPYTAVIKSA